MKTSSFLILLFFTFLIGCDPWDERGVRRVQELESKILLSQGRNAEITILIKKIDDANPVIRVNATASLGRILKERPDYSNDILPALIRSLEQGTRSQQRTAANWLAMAASEYTKKAIPALEAALELGDIDTAWFSAQALGNYEPKLIETTTVVALIKSALSQPATGVENDAPQLRIFAAEALGKVGGISHEATISALLGALDDKNPYFVLSVSNAILKLDSENSKALDVMRKLARSSIPRIRRVATESLK